MEPPLHPKHQASTKFFPPGSIQDSLDVPSGKNREPPLDANENLNPVTLSQTSPLRRERFPAKRRASHDLGEGGPTFEGLLRLA